MANKLRLIKGNTKEDQQEGCDCRCSHRGAALRVVLEPDDVLVDDGLIPSCRQHAVDAVDPRRRVLVARGLEHQHLVWCLHRPADNTILKIQSDSRATVQP